MHGSWHQAQFARRHERANLSPRTSHPGDLVSLVAIPDGGPPRCSDVELMQMARLHEEVGELCKLS